jgi:hypothetical protein
MNAPLIVVHGDLLLPTIYPLAGTPLAAYGDEWTLVIARPALNEFEIPFYAARFLTAYISPLFRNDRFPYTPVSLWGTFKRDDEFQHAPPSQPIEVPPPTAASPAFAFEPFTAPEDTRAEDTRVKTPPPGHEGRKQLAGGAIALACAAFIAWTLFGTKIGHPVAETKLAGTALSATPVAKPMPDENSPVVASVAIPPLPASVVVTPKPLSAAVAAVPGKKGDNSRVVAGIDQPKAIILPAVRQNSTQLRIASDDSTMTRAVSQMLSHHTSNARMKSKAELRGYHDGHRHLSEARRYAQLHHHDGYLGNPTYRSAGRGEPLTSGGQRVIARGNNSANGYLSPAEMYSMLAHSPVLDDNSGLGRASSREVAMPVRSAQRADSAETPNWNGHISQARVTDVPAQFSK